MKRIVHTVASVCALLFLNDAFAQPMQDLSLSPEETIEQNQGGGNNNAPMYQNDIVRRQERLDLTKKPNVAPQQDPDTKAKSFMEGYCDPEFLPILANNSKYFGQEQCLKAIRDNACPRFQQLPKEVKEVLDDAIGCLFTNGNGYAVDKYQRVANDSVACGRSYMMRVEMLKKYSNDYYANNALLFMPDDILDTPGRCVNRR